MSGPIILQLNQENTNTKLLTKNVFIIIFNSKLIFKEIRCQFFLFQKYIQQTFSITKTYTSSHMLGLVI